MLDNWGIDDTVPNVKVNFIPDKDHVIIDVDLEQADAQVVAWEADCQRLKDIFHNPLLDFHSENAFAFFEGMKGEVVEREEEHLPEGVMVKAKKKWRNPLKAGAHATNYRVTAPTLANTLGCTVDEAQDFIDTWFALNPEILEWHRRTEYELATRGYLENKFGFRWRALGRISQRVLNEAQAWVPQSTVGLVINHGWDNIETKINQRTNHFGPKDKEWVKIILQVHDSLVMMVHKNDLVHLLPEIRDCMLIEIPYDDPLTIGVGQPEISYESYGTVKPADWETGEFL